MWNNVGKIVMRLAKFIYWVGIIVSVILAIFIIVNGSLPATGGRSISSAAVTAGIYSNVQWVGWVLLILGPLCSWLSSLALYALGECADNVEELKNTAMYAKSTGGGSAKQNAQKVRTAQADSLSAELPEL